MVSMKSLAVCFAVMTLACCPIPSSRRYAFQTVPLVKDPIVVLFIIDGIDVNTALTAAGNGASGVRHAECRLSKALRARLTFSRISAAFAVQMNGLGVVVLVDVGADGRDQFLDIAEDASPQAVLSQVPEEAFHHV